MCVVLQLSVCKELQLPSSEYNYSADLVAVTSSAAPLETAAVQSISVLAVASEGTARFWPSLSQEGNYSETDVDLGDICGSVVAVRVRQCILTSCFPLPASCFLLPHQLPLSPPQGGSFVVSSVRNRLLRASSDSSGKLQCRALQQGQGVLSGIGRRVSSLFGILSPPTNDTVSRANVCCGCSVDSLSRSKPAHEVFTLTLQFLS